MQVHLHKANELAVGTRATAPGESPQFQVDGGRRHAVGGVVSQKETGTVDLVPSAALPSLLAAAKWRKSRHSNPSGNCVEIARLPGQGVAVRDSRRPDGPVLLFSHAVWETFLRSLREGATELAFGGPGHARAS